MITGSETDVCVLGTVLGAVDLGYRVITVRETPGRDHYLTDNGAPNLAGKLPFSGGTWRKHERWDLTIAFRDLGAEGSP